MAQEKWEQVREHLLAQLESGALSGGDKLPGARQVAAELGVSLPMVQLAFVSLARDGVLESLPRQGTFVRADWNKQVLPNSLVTFHDLPWLKQLEQEMRREVPGLHLRRSFKHGALELLPSLMALRDRSSFLDLSELFDQVYPQKDDFFTAQLAHFYTVDGKLFGIPFIFSPRVMFYNPKILAAAGCPEPSPEWTFADFIGIVRRLRRVLPGERIFNWNLFLSLWGNYVLRAGGNFISRNSSGDYSVGIDSPESRMAIRYYRELREALRLECAEVPLARYREAFGRGETAFCQGEREMLCEFDAAGFTDYRIVPLPHFPGGVNCTLLAADILCVRKHCADRDQVRSFLRCMLSERVQDMLGAARYGIPIRRSSAGKSIRIEEPDDALFWREMPLTTSYDQDFPERSRLIERGCNRIWFGNADVDAICFELGAALRTILKYQQCPYLQALYPNNPEI